MKKTIKILMVLIAIIMLFLPMTISYADSLDSITVDVSSTLVRPGEEVTLTINFGTPLGAYTFDIKYDENIFEYVSVSSGTANDTTGNVKVTFYDSTGGTNPSESLSVVFRAKSGLTTSNPTELTVTAEGLSNSDASVTYDDIVTPIVKNITVEPEYYDYEFSLEYTGEIVAGEEKDMVLSYSSSMGRYYEHARLIAEATTPTDATVKLVGIDQNQGTEDIIQSGWGDPQGYEIGGENVSQVLNVTALFSDAGEYSITLKLIDRDNSDTVIAEKTFSFTVNEKSADDTTNNPSDDPSTGTTDEENGDEVIDETIDNVTDETTDDITDETDTTETNEETTGTEETDTTEETPTTLPKTGINIYIPIAIITAILTGFAVYYNKKNR